MYQHNGDFVYRLNTILWERDWGFKMSASNYIINQIEISGFLGGRAFPLR